MKDDDDENDDDDDEKRGEGRESDENIVVVEQAKNMSFFCRLLVSYVFFSYKFVRVRFRCVAACVCLFAKYACTNVPNRKQKC